MLKEKTKQAAAAVRGQVRDKMAKAAKLTNKYLLFVIAAILGLYIYFYPEMLTKMWTGLRSYSGEAGTNITFEALFQATLFFLCATYIVRRFKKILENYLLAKLKMDTGIKHTIITLMNYGIWIFIALVTLSILGIQLKNLAILFGALSVGIGFGLQNIVNNFVSGIIILFERPIKEGDWVVINDLEGIVRHVRIRATELETFDNASILIPNADILSGKVVNWTHANLNGRVVVPVSVAYGTDLEKVRYVLTDIAKADPRLLADPAPYVWITKFADSGIELELRGVTGDVMSKGAIRSDLMIQISKVFEAEGIEIPFPQQVVYLKK
ncbi:MAG: mechanosensitive ion channel family protein [Alphaproteobacteria bacterium]|nr:mechanosensitive ion channel family protein [Alphaproteobacteria bacterium]